MPTTRTAETIQELLRIAKLDESYSCGPMQAVVFSGELNSDDYRLFEVDGSLANLLTRANLESDLELKDEPVPGNSGRVFLCMENKTFAVVEAETSNSLLLVSDWWLPSSTSEQSKVVFQDVVNTTVHSVKSSYYELHDCVTPSIRYLKQLLRPSVYQGPIEDSLDADSDGSLAQVKYYKVSELGTIFPCSKYELSRALLRLRACELRDNVRIMDSEYLTQVIRDIFACADENSWNWRTNGFPVRLLMDSLSDMHDRHLLRQILPFFFARRSSDVSTVQQNDLSVFPKNSSICQLIGEHLLSVTNTFDLTDFLAVWRAAVPDGLRPKLRKHLTCAGRAFSQPYASSSSGHNSRAFDLNSTRFRSISLLCSEDLPDESVESRLSALFQRCDIWPEAELASYLVELLPSSTDKFDSQPRSDGDVHFSLVDSDSDFDYVDLIDLDDESHASTYDTADIPKPVPPAVSPILNKLCRVTTSKWGRFYTERHAQI